VAQEAVAYEELLHWQSVPAKDYIAIKNVDVVIDLNSINANLETTWN
jgi:hypothetical protein